MHGVRARSSRGVDHAGNVQVAGGRGRGTDWLGGVGVANVRSVRIGLGVDSHARDAHRATGTNDATGDLPSVGNENPLDHESGGFVHEAGRFSRKA